MDHPIFILSNQKEDSISDSLLLKTLKTVCKGNKQITLAGKKVNQKQKKYIFWALTAACYAPVGRFEISKHISIKECQY